MLFKLLLTVLIPSFLYAYQPSTVGGEQNELPEAIEGVGITEKLDQPLPGDVELIDEEGKKLRISDFYSENKPVILSLVYYSCPSLCNLHLQGVFEVFRELKLTPGKDFEFLAVSFDSKEGPDVALAKKENYIAEFLGDQPGVEKGVHFLTASQESIDKLTKGVGFAFKWNANADEWAHASAAIVTTPKGQISRYLHGVFFEPKTFRLSVVEASKGMIGNLADNFALFCFRYDPKTNKYSFYIINILRGLAGLVLLGLMIWLIPFWYRAMKSAQ